jgi:hypothetical protein
MKSREEGWRVALEEEMAGQKDVRPVAFLWLFLV